MPDYEVVYEDGKWVVKDGPYHVSLNGKVMSYESFVYRGQCRYRQYRDVHNCQDYYAFSSPEEARLYLQDLTAAAEEKALALKKVKAAKRAEQMKILQSWKKTSIFWLPPLLLIAVGAGIIIGQLLK